MPLPPPGLLRKGRPLMPNFRDGSYDGEHEARPEEGGLEDDGAAGRLEYKRGRRIPAETEGFGGGYGVGAGGAIAVKAGPSGLLGQCRTSLPHFLHCCHSFLLLDWFSSSMFDFVLIIILKLLRSSPLGMSFE